MSITATAADVATYDLDAATRRSVGSFAADVAAGRYPVVPKPVATVLAARDTVAEARRSQPAPETPVAARDAVTASLIQSGKLPKGYDSRCFEADDAQSRVEHRSRLLEYLSARVERQVKTTVGAHVDELLDGLRDSLDTVVSELRCAYDVLGDLDLDAPDPEVVAAGSDDFRAAIGAVAEGTRRYRTIRRLQAAALALGSPVPDTSLRIIGWDDVARQGILELSALDTPGLPGEDLGKRGAVSAVVERDDVWLPSLSELAERWQEMFGVSGHVPVSAPSRQASRVRPGETIYA